MANPVPSGLLDLATADMDAAHRLTVPGIYHSVLSRSPSRREGFEGGVVTRNQNLSEDARLELIGRCHPRLSDHVSGLCVRIGCPK